MLSRTLVPVIWLIAIAGLALWSLLAWGTGTLIDGGGDWLSQLAVLSIENARKEAFIATALSWLDSAGAIVVWAMWALGSLGLLLAAAFATLLLRRTGRIEPA